MNEATNNPLLRFRDSERGMVEILRQVPEVWSTPLFRTAAQRKRSHHRHEIAATYRATMQETKFFRWSYLKQWRYWKLYGWYCGQLFKIVVLYRFKRWRITLCWNIRYLLWTLVFYAVGGLNRFLDWLKGRL